MHAQLLRQNFNKRQTLIAEATLRKIKHVISLVLIIYLPVYPVVVFIDPSAASDMGYPTLRRL